MISEPLVLDLSHWETVDSWEEVKNSGIVGIIYKATEGSSYTDDTYEEAKDGAEAAGLLWGAYHFLRPGDMLQQARFFVDVVGTGLDLYCADHEDYGVSIEELKEFMLEVLRMTGKHCILYSGHVLKEQIGNSTDEVLGKFRLWVAHYTGNSQPDWPKQIWPQWWLWQYSETGEAPGISDETDLNRYSGAGPSQLTHEWSRSMQD